jgi:plasmid stabilization system protein ParE
MTALEVVLDRLVETPDLYPTEYKSVRRAKMKRFPYVVYYRLVRDRIDVIAVQHGGRNSRSWRSRA